MVRVETIGTPEVALNLLGFARDQTDRLRLACIEIARLLETWAIMHHRWHVQTGATNVTTLGTWDEVADGIFEVVLSAGMFYNPFLEFGTRYTGFEVFDGIRQGPYAWIWPAMVANQMEILTTLERYLKH